MESQKSKVKSQKFGSSRQVSNKRYFVLGQVLLFVLLFLVVSVNQVFAQSLDPNSWQQGATGLRTQNNLEKKTGGLSMSVTAQAWPFLAMPGGVQFAGWGSINGGEVDIELGQIKIPGVSSSAFSSESADWARNEMTFNSGGSQLKITASRLTPALLINSSANSLRFLAGNVNQYVDFETTNQTSKSGPSTPKYVAYSSGGSIQVRALSGTALNLPALDQKWILVWYGSNSHFYSTKLPNPQPFYPKRQCCESPVMPKAVAYQADAPLLLTFQNNPTSIVQSSEGGFDLNFSAGGYTTIMPLYGRDLLQASDTNSWTNSIPATVTQKINFWVQRSCDFPVSASESYNYDSSQDRVTVTDNITFNKICSGGTSFSIIPPILALARNSLNPQFSAMLVDSGYASIFGPIVGFDNTTSYSWSLSNLKKYTNQIPANFNPNAVPADLRQELIREVDKITSQGHFAPWYVGTKMSMNPLTGDLYFANPGEVVYLLSEVAPILPEPQKTNLINYIKSERTSFPPESTFNMSLTQGVERGNFNHLYQGSPIYNILPFRKYLNLSRVPLYNIYALSRFYSLTGDPVPASILTQGKTALNNEAAEQDFATMYYFKNYEVKKTAVENANRYLAGLIGLSRFSGSETSTNNLVHGLLAKAIVLRVGMTKLPAYYATTGIEALPTGNPAWQPQSLARNWIGVLYNYNWNTVSDDARQVASLNQFNVNLFDNAGFNLSSEVGTANYQINGETYAYLSGFRDLVPESALILKDFAKAESENYVNKYTSLMPHWYAGFIDTPLGSERGFSLPIDSYQLFMAKKWILGENGDSLKKYLDIPWLSLGGDLFYLQKLSETAKAYAASGSPLPSVAPSLTPSPAKVGDVDGNNRVDIFDYNLILTDFGKTGNLATNIDRTGSSADKVDIFDYNLVLTNFGK